VAGPGSQTGVPATWAGVPHHVDRLDVHTFRMERKERVVPDVRQRAPDRFPFTKFVPPALDARVVTEHLVDRLDAVIGPRPLTVLVAPAGSGKTTALAAWASAATDDVVWVRLDPEDDEPSALAAALLEGGRRQLGTEFGGRLAQLLAYAGPAPTRRQLVASLVNDLGDHGAVTVVLDDVHAVSGRATLVLLEDLLDHLPPDVRIVLGSRVEPEVALPRRRVRGEVAVLGLEDLRLDREAVRRVLAHEVAISDEQVDEVLTASNGWAAAVRLATTHVGAGPASTVGARLGAAVVLTDLRPFLATEVLGALPERLRTFLLETSILDELTPGICDLVTGREDSARVLEELDRRNLFVTRHRVGSEDTWRTHDLFTAFLREQLASTRDAAALAELHRRASRCLPPLRALPHLLAANEHAAAAELIVALGLSNLDVGMQLHLAPSIRALPSEVREADHRLALLLASIPLVTGDPHAVLAQLEPLRDRLLAYGDEVAAAEVNGSLVPAYLQLGDLGAAEVALEQALSHTGAVWHRPSTLAVGMWLCFYRNDWAGVSRLSEEALDLVLSSADPNLAKAVGPALSPQLLFVDRGPSWLATTVDRLRAGLSDDDHATVTALRPVRAGAALLRLEVTEAATELRRCLDESTGYGRMAWTHQEAECLLMAVCLGSGDLATVRRVLDGTLPRLDDPVYRQYRHIYVYAAMRAHWLTGEHRDLMAIHDRLLAAQPAGELAEERVVRAIAEAMMARITGRTEAALEVLRVGEQAQRDGRCWLWTGMPGLDRASILLELGRTAAAIEAALPTLDRAADLGPGILFPEVRANQAVLERCARAGVHTDLVRAVLTASPGAHVRGPVPIPGTDETLSKRELEVLAQVATGASNRQIAGELFISEPTVKSHLTRILRKLDASSRTHAVARARELRLL
jgi:LuxR family transcriptional regulator, maltose regulon positive regulatory protein